MKEVLAFHCKAHVFGNNLHEPEVQRPITVVLSIPFWKSCPDILTEGPTWLSAAAEPLWDRLVQTPFPLSFLLIEHKLPVHLWKRKIRVNSMQVRFSPHCRSLLVWSCVILLYKIVPSSFSPYMFWGANKLTFKSAACCRWLEMTALTHRPGHSAVLVTFRNEKNRLQLLQTSWAELTERKLGHWWTAKVPLGDSWLRLLTRCCPWGARCYQSASAFLWLLCFSSALSQDVTQRSLRWFT